MGACKTCQATGSRSLASPLLGADATHRRRLRESSKTSEVWFLAERSEARG